MPRGREDESRGVQASEARPALYRGPLSSCLLEIGEQPETRAAASGRALKPTEGSGGQHLMARRMRLSSDVVENCIGRRHKEKG